MRDRITNTGSGNSFEEHRQESNSLDENLPVRKKRQPWIAGLLTFLVIGLGQVYNGEFKRGIIYYLGSLAISLISAFIMLFLPFPTNFITFFLLGFLYFFIIFLISWREARVKGTSYRLKSYNKLHIYISFIFFSWYIINPLFSQFIKNNIVHAYRVVATSMTPTILDGDHILVNELIYKFTSPGRGDVVVFRYPKNENQYFIKRIIGLPGETILIYQKHCYIDGELLQEGYLAHSSHAGAAHPEMDDFGPLTLPPASFFVMGDNRDWSMDSRSFGPVQQKKILGKAFMIYWSGSLNGQIYWDRIGKSLD